MTTKGRAGIVFQVETSRILEILASEIYDSPHALLRENVQNAYDAILMRFTTAAGVDGKIDVSITPLSVSVRDNGVGMDESVLRDNFWKAGSSGKRTEAAQRAGVVGTFGIGAMANFGVAEEVTVRTRAAEGGAVLESRAKRSELSIQEECIELTEIDEEFEPGTLVRVQLDANHTIDVTTAVEYLRSYVALLSVPVICNGILISQEEWETPPEVEGRTARPLGTLDIALPGGRVQADVVTFGQNARVMVELHDFQAPGYDGGRGVLIQQASPLMGYRNWFGLAPIPITGHYAFGGHLNLPLLQPTAGREALSRDSIQRVASLVAAVETAVSQAIADTDLADKNAAFLNHARIGPIEWSRNVAVRVAPFEEREALGSLAGKKLMYFTGSDAQTIHTYASRESPLVVLDQSNPRRKLQLRYINNVLQLPEVPDRPSVQHVYTGPELSYPEAAFLIRSTTVLIEEYLIADVHIELADLSHGVQVLVEARGDAGVVVYLSRSHPSLGAVVQSYTAAGDAFGAFVRDFIRMNVYDKIASYVPSATRHGAEALLNQIRRTRELFHYDEEELGPLEPLLDDLLSGDITVGEAIRQAGRRVRPQAQRVTRQHIGTVEEEMPDVVHPADPSHDPLGALPPILRGELETNMKILTADHRHPSLNNFTLFLGLSERATQRELPFFQAPHQTRVMWAQHRIVYVFTHAAGDLSLYYDIELMDGVPAGSPGGLQLPTTTVVTKRRIFVPVPDELHDAFALVDGERKFHVRFDTLVV